MDLQLVHEISPDGSNSDFVFKLYYNRQKELSREFPYEADIKRKVIGIFEEAKAQPQRPA